MLRQTVEENQLKLMNFVNKILSRLQYFWLQPKLSHWSKEVGVCGGYAGGGGVGVEHNSFYTELYLHKLPTKTAANISKIVALNKHHVID